jgi:hypothetical protein
MTNDEMISLNEAPASVTLSVVTPKGFPALFTVRDTSGLDLLAKLDTIEKKLEEKGFKPQVKTFGGGFPKKEVEYVEGEVCPKDKGRLIKKLTKAGKPYYACENGHYDFKTGVKSGCDFVNWLNPIV